MEKFFHNAMDIYEMLRDSLLDFSFTLSNPWVWIFSTFLFFVFLHRWGLKKLLWFVGVFAVLIFARMKIQENLHAKGLIRPDNFTLMIENIIFYIVAGIVVVYFVFVKE